MKLPGVIAVADVVTNALQLRWFKPKHTVQNNSAAETASVQADKKGETPMDKLLRIEGMMCNHCSCVISQTKNVRHARCIGGHSVLFAQSFQFLCIGNFNDASDSILPLLHTGSNDRFDSLGGGKEELLAENRDRIL